ncbi:hypothetical protein GC163_04200 [bacterium]|nr:hypothetical protein [bacterium]
MTPLPQVPLPPQTFYTCPNERHAIPRSVHLARLGRSYAACRDCPHRHDSGLVPASVVQQMETTRASLSSQIRLVPTGLRGRYLNDIVRQDGYRWGCAVAGIAWSERPWTGRFSDSLATSAPRPDVSQPTVPVIVVGYDERPSSPDLAIGVVTGLRHAGICVLDIGMVTRPIWHFAVSTLQADAGVLITGAGCDVNWTGCDLIGRAGTPWRQDQELAVWFERLQQPVSRPVRTASSVQALAVSVPYQDHVRRHFHALRPLRLAVAVSSQTVAYHLEHVFRGLPVSLELSVDADWRDPRDLPARIASLPNESLTDAVVWIAEDGEHCRVFDADRRPLSGECVAQWLQEGVQSGAIDLPVAPLVSSLTIGWQNETVRQAGPMSPGNRVDSDPVPCDAILTIAAILQAMSWSDAPLAEQLTGVV